MSEFVTKQIDAQLKTCRDCESEIAAEAENCPHCGSEIAAEAKDGRYPGFWSSGEWKTYALILAFIAILVIVALRLMQPQIVNTLNNCCDSL